MNVPDRLRPLLHKKVVIPAAIVVVALVVILALPDPDPRAPEPAPLSVPVALVVEDVRPGMVRTGGVVEPGRRTMPATRTGARVLAVPVAEGDQVSAGQLLVRLDDRELRAGVEAARAQVAGAEEALAAARRNVGRMRRLAAEDLVAPVQVEEAELREAEAQAAVVGAHAQLEQARSMLEETEVRAPFAGVVTAVLVEVGEMAAPGRPLVVLEDRSRFNVVTPVGAEVGLRLEPGTVVDVVLPDGREVTGRLAAVLPGEPERPGIWAEIDLGPLPALRPGMTVSVFLPTDVADPRPVRLVPADALFRRGQLVGVFVVSSGPPSVHGPVVTPDDDPAGEPGPTGPVRQRAYLRWVTTEEPWPVRDGLVRALTGVEPGDSVVVGPRVEDLWNGRPVTVVQVREGA